MVTVHDDFDNLFVQQNPSLWFVNMFNIHSFDIDADATWDEDELDKVLASMDFLDEKNMTAPEDAYIGINEDQFDIIEEVQRLTGLNLIKLLIMLYLLYNPN